MLFRTVFPSISTLLAIQRHTHQHNILQIIIVSQYAIRRRALPKTENCLFFLFRRCALLPSSSSSSSWSSDVCHFTIHAYVCQLIDGGSIVLVRSPSHIDPFHSQQASHSESEHFSFTDEHKTNKKMNPRRKKEINKSRERIR